MIADNEKWDDKPTFVIFGRIIHIYPFLKMLKERGWKKPFVICNEDREFAREKRLLSEFGLWCDLEKYEEEGFCSLKKCNNCNDPIILSFLESLNNKIGFSINSRDIIKKPIIDSFDGKIFNLHDSFLPNERGAALNSWRIMNGINSVGNTIHYLDESIDGGDIILQREEQMSVARPRPIDYLLVERENCRILLENFIDELEAGSGIVRSKQNNDASFYYPRLFTEINGLIDWNDDPVHIERFIRAFSTPYPGAFSYLKGKKVHILDCIVDQKHNEMMFNKFLNGRIVTQLDNGSVRIIGGQRAMIINEVLVDETSVLPSEVLKINSKIVADQKEIDEARKFSASTKIMADYEENGKNVPA